MRQFFPVEDLARDERFVQTNMAERMRDVRSPRSKSSSETNSNRVSDKSRAASARLTPDRHDASDAARSLMHGIMTGEIQALEGAGRTAHDFATGDGTVTGELHGWFAGLGRPTPLHYASVGVAVSILAHWTSRRWALGEEPPALADPEIVGVAERD